jgi:hypothetical protein
MDVHAIELRYVLFGWLDGRQDFLEVAQLTAGTELIRAFTRRSNHGFSPSRRSRPI